MSRITFQKRQKEMKRQEKQRAKAERRAQKKLAKRANSVDDNPELAPAGSTDEQVSESLSATSSRSES